MRTPANSSQNYDLGSLTCPECRCALNGLPHETGVSWKCPQCGGQSLNFSQFRRFIPDKHVNEIWVTAKEQPTKPAKPVACPECSREMHGVLVPFPSGDQELDICSPCQRLWMKRAQPDSPLFISHSSERLEQPPKRVKLPRVSMKGIGGRLRNQSKLDSVESSGSAEVNTRWQLPKTWGFGWISDKLDDWPMMNSIAQTAWMFLLIFCLRKVLEFLWSA